MLFGLRSALAMFQRVVDIILCSERWQFALVYLDDTVVFSRALLQHINLTRTVPVLLRKTGVILKLMKCAFSTNKIDYLGQIIRPGGLEVPNNTTDAIRHLKAPTKKTELRIVIGLCSVFCQFLRISLVSRSRSQKDCMSRWRKILNK